MQGHHSSVEINGVAQPKQTHVGQSKSSKISTTLKQEEEGKTIHGRLCNFDQTFVVHFGSMIRSGVMIDGSCLRSNSGGFIVYLR